MPILSLNQLLNTNYQACISSLLWQEKQEGMFRKIENL